MLPCHGRGRGFESRPVRKGFEKSKPFFMPYYVYILKSEKDGTYYKGSSEDYMRRFMEHNEGLSKYTSFKTPWKLIYVEACTDKRSALIRERKLKRCKEEYFEWLTKQVSNILNTK
jgi:putative endonuclease